MERQFYYNSYQRALLIAAGLFLLYKPTQAQSIAAASIKGDFDGDGKPDTVWIVKPKLNEDGIDCKGKCQVTIKSTLKGIQDIAVDQSIGGQLANLGDINGDGRDDIGFLPEWFAGCWSRYQTYTLKNGKWQPLVAPIPTHCNQWEANIIPLVKIDGKPGYAKENYSVFDHDSIVVRSRVVKVAR